MEGRQGRAVSHAEIEDFLRRFGHSPEQVRDLLRDLPDPDALGHVKEVLAKHGITTAGLMDRMGGSP